MGIAVNGAVELVPAYFLFCSGVSESIGSREGEWGRLGSSVK